MSPFADGAIRVLITFGTRPEAIKLAPVIRALQESRRFQVIVCATGQHREMLDQVLDLFRIETDYDLDVMRPDQALPELMCGLVRSITGVLTAAKPDLVLVQGDTTTTMAAAMASFYERIPVAHLEAGLRSDDMTSPWPEEMNRRVVTMLAGVHFAPTEHARARLLREGVRADCLCTTGNTVIDALLQAVERMRGNAAVAGSFRERFKDLQSGRRMVLVTSHRRESWGPGLENICRAVRHIADTHDVDVVYPVHRNPHVQETALRVLAGAVRVHLTEPLDYLAFVYLLDRCHFVVTDSGGVQEEAPALGKPVLVVRDTTERPEGIEAGVARLVGTNQARIVDAMAELLTDRPAYESMARRANPYGDGCAATRAVSFLEEWWDRTSGSRPIAAGSNVDTAVTFDA